MAEKRMFSKKVTDNDEFIKLSSSAQALYFHLNQGADDDGFNNQVELAMFKSHASSDDLIALLGKKFLLRFESGVVVIKHWWMHNTLRKDRYKTTNYQNELKALGVKDNGSYTLLESKNKVGCHLVAKVVTQNRLDKNSIDKIRLDKNIEDKSSMSADTDTKTPLINYSSILKYWNERSLLKEITAITDKRKSNLHARIKEHGVEAIFKMIDQVKNSSFLRGNNKQSWTANFDWCIRPNNFVKILEGNYLDASKKSETLSEQVDRKVNDLNTKLGIFNSKEPERYV